MRILILFIFIFFHSLLSAQQKDTWYAFYNKDSTLIGYKDSNHKIQITPKFTEFTTAMRFNDIIAVSERLDASWKSYYLNKNRKQFGNDSLYVTDNTADCENEGYVRFRDHKTDKAGIFHHTGIIAVPAVYNDLSKVRNGLVAGLLGARKKYMHEDREKNGDNYFVWTGGMEVLIDIKNNVLVENFPNNTSLDFYSVMRSPVPSTDKTRKNFRSVNGDYYSFIDFEKEFYFWLEEELVPNLSREYLTNASFDTIIWESRDGWNKSEHGLFVGKNYELLSQSLSDFHNPEAHYDIFMSALNPFLFEGNAFDVYFNECNEGKTWKYPVMSLVFSYNLGKDGFSQNHFDFLRTEKGYKLILVTIRTGKLK